MSATSFEETIAAEARSTGIRGHVSSRPALQIAAAHAIALTAGLTDFARIALPYAHLSRVAPSPIVDLNRAIAVAFSEGPDAGLALLDTLNLDAHLGGIHLLHSTRADLLRRAGRPADALPHDRRALELAPSDPERRFLQRHLDGVSRNGWPR